MNCAGIFSVFDSEILMSFIARPGSINLSFDERLKYFSVRNIFATNGAFLLCLINYKHPKYNAILLNIVMVAIL